MKLFTLFSLAGFGARAAFSAEFLPDAVLIKRSLNDADLDLTKNKNYPK